MAANQTINNNSIRSILDKEKLNGSNFLDWYRNLRIVLRNEQKLYHLEEALPEAPPATAPAAVRNAYTHRQVEQELFKTVKSFHACKHEEGQSVSTYVLKMKSYSDQMERLGYPMPLVFGVNMILTSLSKDYDWTILVGTLKETLTKGTKGALHLGPERPRVYSDLTSEEKDRFITTVKLNRGLRDSNYDQLYAYLKQHENKGQGNNARGAGATGYGGAQNIVGFANPEYFKEKMLLMQAKENGVKLDEEQLLFITGGQDNVVDDDMDDQPIQYLALNVDNVFQADDCDAFDSNVDEAPTAQTMFMDNLSSADPVYDEAGSSYDLDVLSEIHDHDHYQDPICEHHEYVKDNAVQVVHSDVSAVPNDAYKVMKLELRIGFSCLKAML
nr:hypothetical protein [Tanacetum cinerariifolium]